MHFAIKSNEFQNYSENQFANSLFSLSKCYDGVCIEQRVVRSLHSIFMENEEDALIGTAE